MVKSLTRCICSDWMHLYSVLASRLPSTPSNSRDNVNWHDLEPALNLRSELLITSTIMDSTKNIHTLILDSGPILKNEPTVSTLVKQTEALVTVPAVIAEIRDASARSRLETTLLPFLTLRDPKPESLQVVSEFARKTGDYEVLSRTDLRVLALAYEVECEKNGGDWRLRRTPGQRRLNGAPPSKTIASEEMTELEQIEHQSEEQSTLDLNEDRAIRVEEEIKEPNDIKDQEGSVGHSTQDGEAGNAEHLDELQTSIDELGTQLQVTDLLEPFATPDGEEVEDEVASISKGETPKKSLSEVSDDNDDGEGWITPSNIKRHQDKESSSGSKASQEQKVMQAVTLTTDFAMQNVLLQMNLNLVSPSLQRIRHLRTYILRCHACFATTKDMTKQFCGRCGKPTMLRVSCSTHENGEFRMHLKRNMQWNTRGDRYSIPKPVGGSASGKINVGGGGKGGGKGGWGQGLLLAEDQKEYQRALKDNGPKTTRDLLDEDYLPGIFTGDRNRAGGRPKVGAGRNVNSKRRR